ncbi:DUF6924 domain-containing protein [Streptomyces olivaceus]|uniref:DUF6924 domain-containing protein n=1 Tax=Streptomyces olivaceus TaxID=47716 RepID=UPI00363C4A13
MRVLPTTDEDSPPILVVRTDYRDDAAWQRLKADLDVPWVFDERDEDNGRLKEDVLFVEDPSWTGAGPAEILAVLTASDECGWEVVFLADRVGLSGPRPTLLAVSTDPEEETPPFRVAALSTPHEMHCNLGLANMDFSDFEGWDGLPEGS